MCEDVEEEMEDVKGEFFNLLSEKAVDEDEKGEEVNEGLTSYVVI
jgi:hypothetical protein